MAVVRWIGTHNATPIQVKPMCYNLRQFANLPVPLESLKLLHHRLSPNLDARWLPIHLEDAINCIVLVLLLFKEVLGSPDQSLFLSAPHYQSTHLEEAGRRNLWRDGGEAE